MNRILFLAIISFALFASVTASAQDHTGKADSLATAIRIKVLKDKQLQLKKQIVAEDRKRNQQIEGVSFASLGQMNERQDSICIDLRSRLVSVELELKEVTSSKAKMSAKKTH